MLFIRFSASKRCILLVAFISLNGEIMSPYSRYIKKGLVYIAIISPFNCQSSFYFEYTKANTRSLCDMRLVPFNKYKCLYYVRYYAY